MMMACQKGSNGGGSREHAWCCPHIKCGVFEELWRTVGAMLGI